MTDFSLTHPPARPAPRRKGNSAHWESEAVTRWLDCQLVSHDLDEACRKGAEIGQRLMKGDIWLRQHGDGHPKSAAARKTHNRLVSAQQVSLHQQKHLYVALWLRVCGLSGALSLVDDVDRWLRLHAPDVPGSKPETIWHVLQPNRSPPFTTHPPPIESYYIERGFETQEQLNAWMHRGQETQQ